jgi:hypothetical protein
MTHATLLLVLPLAPPGPAAGEAPVVVSEGWATKDGALVHEVTSPYQSGTTLIRVLRPDKPAAAKRYPAVYILPVETGTERRYGLVSSAPFQPDRGLSPAAFRPVPSLRLMAWQPRMSQGPPQRSPTSFSSRVARSRSANFWLSRSLNRAATHCGSIGSAGLSCSPAIFKAVSGWAVSARIARDPQRHRRRRPTRPTTGTTRTHDECDLRAACRSLPPFSRQFLGRPKN